MLIKATAPCKGCDIRELGCHSSCAEYLEFRKARDEMNARRQAEISGKPQLTPWIKNNVKRMERWK